VITRLIGHLEKVAQERKQSMLSRYKPNQNEERITVFNINLNDLLILTILIAALKLDGYLDLSWLGVAAPLTIWWIFGKLVVLVVGIFSRPKPY
jgi:predicted small integral membrane protein